MATAMPSNARALIGITTSRGDSGPQLYSVDIWGRNNQQVPTESFASDPALVAAQDVRLVPVTLAALDAEDVGVALATRLGVAAPSDWPPPFNDENTRQWMRGRLSERPDLARWMAYYIIGDISGVERVVGQLRIQG